MVRDSTAEDVPALCEIYGRHVAHGVASFELEPPSVAEMARRRAAIVERGLPYLVAELEGHPAGYAYIAPYRARPAYRHTVEDSVYVAANALGRGIGRQLLSALIEHAETRGFRQMIAVVGVEHDPAERERSASIHLHRTLGFRHVGVLEGSGYKFGRWIDTVYMQRALGPGADAPPALDPTQGAGR